MKKKFIKKEIETGFEKERELLEHEPDKKNKVSPLAYVRPLIFTTLLTITLSALVIRLIAIAHFYF